MEIWRFLLSLIEGVSGLYYFLVPVLVMAAFAMALRLASNHYF